MSTQRFATGDIVSVFGEVSSASDTYVAVKIKGAPGLAYVDPGDVSMAIPKFRPDDEVTFDDGSVRGWFGKVIAATDRFVWISPDHDPTAPVTMPIGKVRRAPLPEVEAVKAVAPPPTPKALAEDPGADEPQPVANSSSMDF